MSVPFAACMALVASVYGLPPRVLASIQDVEGGRPGLVSRNTNGSEDLGVMQVNTLWVPALTAYTRLPAAIVRERLTDDACFNVGAAGAILRSALDESRGDVLRAVATYHSRTPSLGARYRERVLAAARRLFAGAQAAGVPRPRPERDAPVKADRDRAEPPRRTGLPAADGAPEPATRAEAGGGSRLRASLDPTDAPALNRPAAPALLRPGV